MVLGLRGVPVRIAAYLKRDVSTVQRWEKREGMPVHRHQHNRLGSVYAFRTEVDRWWRERSRVVTPAVATASTPQLDVRDCMLRVRYLSDRTTDADTRAAIALLERAVALDRDSAPAHAQLAAAHVSRLAFVAPEDTCELEQRDFAAAERALMLDPSSPRRAWRAAICIK